MNKIKLDVVKPFDPWRSPLCTCPMKWVIHPYTGCGHGCLYCYAASYIPRHHLVRAKENFLSRLRKDILKIPKGVLIEMSSSSDPYPPIEAYNNLTRQALHMLLSQGFKVLVLTKSTLVVRDLDILTKFKDQVVISFTITTLRESISANLEPRAPTPLERLKAVELLTRNGINVVARVDPIIPLINDDYNDLRGLVKELNKRGVKQIISSTYKAKRKSLEMLTKAFPAVGKKIADLYGKDVSEVIHGYLYLNKNVRFYYMKLIKEIVEEEGLVFGICREGFFNLNTPGFACDGSTHLYIT